MGSPLQKEMSRMAFAMQDRDVDEGDEQWSLSRFAPLMQEVLEDLAVNKLSLDEYPYVQPPSNDAGLLPHILCIFLHHTLPSTST